MNSGLNVRWNPKGVSLTGALDDRTTADDLARQIPLDRLGSGPFEIDVEGVTRGNSIGMVEWEKFAKGITIPHYYKRSQFWLVSYFNLIASFFENENAVVHSFFAPFICEADESGRNVLLVVGKDIPLLEKYDSFQLTDLNIGGKIYVPDFDPRRYLTFLSRNRQRFLEFLNKHQLS